MRKKKIKTILTENNSKFPKKKKKQQNKINKQNMFQKFSEKRTI